MATEQAAPGVAATATIKAALEQIVTWADAWRDGHSDGSEPVHICHLAVRQGVAVIRAELAALRRREADAAGARAVIAWYADMANHLAHWDTVLGQAGWGRTAGRGGDDGRVRE